ncbi:MAG: ATP-binding protein [Pontiellaceae bacterium]|nr:ATP-binding protein [Pontiellaceae bacterium]MBN2783294.1 ATP-binding protein [Pontiellaceae bacterium]
MNPFKIDGIVDGADYMPRKESEELLNYHRAGRNVLIRGPRRTGKSSLVVNTFRDTECLFLRVDFWGVKTEMKAVEKIARAFEPFCKKLPMLSGFNIGGIGLQWKSPEAVSSVEDLLRLAPGLHRKKPVVIFFDEFQALLDLPDSDQFLGALRSEIQAQPEVQYIFAGSNQNRLMEIFYSQRSPFFKSAALMEVGGLDRDDFVAWLEDKFAATDRSISPRLWDAIFELSHAIPGDVQDICYHLWNDSTEGGEIGPEDLGATLKRVLQERASGYAGMWNMLTDNQQKIAMGLTRYRGEMYASNEFLQMCGTTSHASVKRGIEALESKGLIWMSSSRWIFSDPFFTLWIANSVDA